MLLAAVDFDNLHQVLRVLYDEMMPLCSNMTGVAKGIAGLGASHRTRNLTDNWKNWAGRPPTW